MTAANVFHAKRKKGSCPETVSSRISRMYDFRACPHPVREGDEKCRLHASVDAKRAARVVQRNELEKQDDAVVAEGARLAKRFKLTGAYTYYNSHGPTSTWRYERALVVGFDDLVRLAAQGGAP